MATNGFMTAHAGAINHQAGLVVINNTTMISGVHEVYIGQANGSGEVFGLDVGKMGLRKGCS